MKNNLFKLWRYLIISLLVLVFQLISFCATADNAVNYLISSIPKELKSGAFAVVRNQEMVFTCTSLSSAVLHVHQVTSILNKKAIKLSIFNEVYNKFTKINNIKFIIYDEFGNIVKKISKDDIKDISAISGGTLFSDARLKLINPEYRTVPFTIEYWYDETFDGFLYTPYWLVYPAYKVSIQNSSFTITSPQNMPLRYYQRNFDVAPFKSTYNGNVTVSWKVNNIQAVKYEVYSLSLYETSPLVVTAPSKFSIENVEGNFNSWHDFGLWISKLNKNRSELPEATKKEITSMLSDTLTKLETTRMLYKWMQNRTRYVSIQMGIGGWQPILAEDVDKFSYGDCKALSNYMYSILQVADIKSYYTLVHAGYSASKMITEFPSAQFNHAILCVPIKTDTVWLECTNQQNPFGYINGFTDDRDVLLINDDGGKIVRTRTYNKTENFKNTVANITIDENGNATATISDFNSGIYYNMLIPIIMSSDKERIDNVADKINIPSFKIINYSFSENKSMLPFVNEKIDLTVNSYASKLGMRLIFDVNMLNKFSLRFKHAGERRNKIVLKHAFMESDSITYKLPVGISIESLPAAANISSEFGSYSTQFVVDSTKVIYIRNLEVNKGEFPKTSFNNFKKFATDIETADNQKIVLIKSD